MKKENKFDCFLLLLIVIFFLASRSRMASATSLGVKKLLSRLNKTPVKSIQSPDGDIIDCVNMYNQPAFDHPLLKNHTIQMRPSYYLEGREFNDSKVSRGKGHKLPITQLWHLNGRCPKRTIPIRRIKEEDIMRANSWESFGMKERKSIPTPKSVDLDRSISDGDEVAVAYVQSVHYYGTREDINIWNPKIEDPFEESFSQLWIEAGLSDYQDNNVIEAGWMVSPKVYGDANARIFIYWTSDRYQSTGCYNLVCAGFIQTNRDIAWGAILQPLSIYDGEQFSINLYVWKDQRSGNWWVYFNNNIVGYFPKSLFTYLNDGASTIQWGGRVLNLNRGLHTGTEMGNGHFPKEGFGRASFIGNIQIVDDKNKLRDPDELLSYTPKPACYNGTLGKDSFVQNFYLFGGPGRNYPNCP